MRILFCIAYYEPAWAYGGPPRMAFDLARALAERGHQVTVCTTDALDDGTRVKVLEDVSHGVRVVRFPNLSNRVAYGMKIFLPIGMRPWLDQHIGEFDVVHLFEARTLLNGWAGEAASRRRIPFLLSVWGSLPRGEGWRSLIKRLYDRRYGAAQLAQAAALLAQNEHECELYCQYGAERSRVHIWPLGIDPRTAADQPERGAFRERLGISQDAPVVLFVGRISELKGLDPLLRAFAAAHREVPSAQLVVVGRDDGFLRSMLVLAEALGIASSLHFVGPLYDREVLPAYVDCDLFAITPTHFEETSLASLMACALGKPVLINERCGLPWLHEYEAGVSVTHSVEALSRALADLLSDRNELARMGVNAQRMVEERFLLPRVIEQLEGLYAQAVGEQSGGRS